VHLTYEMEIKIYIRHLRLELTRALDILDRNRQVNWTLEMGVDTYYIGNFIGKVAHRLDILYGN
jgi:hypothetical protein